MASKYKVGQEVIVTTKEIPEKKGTVRFVGKIEGRPDEYVGVELDEPFGKNNGDYEGKSYYKVEKKSDKGQFYGVFVKAASLKPVGAPSTAATDPKKPSTRPSNRPQQPPPPPAAGKNKLSNELIEQQNSEIQAIKEELEAAYEKIRVFETMDHVKEIEALRTQLRELEELNRNLKLQVE